MKSFKKTLRRAVCLLLLACTLASALALQSCKKTTYDYMEINLNRYIKIDESAYKNFTVTVSIPLTSENDINDAYIQALCDYKKDASVVKPAIKNAEINIGDIVNLYYNGYVIEDGEKSYFASGCNIGGDICSLEIGSGTFVSGFEYNLIGHNPTDYATLEEITVGFVTAGDIISLTYSAIRADGTSENNKTVMVNLADSSVDQTYGAGFSDYFCNSEKKLFIGTEYATETDTSDEDFDALIVDSISGSGSDLYHDITVNKIYRVNTQDGTKAVLDIEAYFPYNYSTEELQGRTAHFEVYARTVQNYEVPELDESFLTDKLGIDMDELNGYEGETLEAKYRSYLKAQLDAQRDEAVESAVQTAFWEMIIDKATFKKLPVSDVKRYYNDNYDYILSSYNSAVSGGTTSYSTLDAYARDQMGITDSTVNWKYVLKADSETAIKQKLVFYYIVKKEGYIPSESESARIRAELIAELAENQLISAGYSKTDADYEAKYQAMIVTVESAYDDKYWDANAQYVYGMEKICESAIVIEE